MVNPKFTNILNRVRDFSTIFSRARNNNKNKKKIEKTPINPNSSPMTGRIKSV